MKLANKVALITGGASGIGLGCAEAFLANGVKGITIADIDDIHGKEVAQTLNKRYPNSKVIFVKTDTTNRSDYDDAFKKTIDEFSQVDILVNNAGIIDEVNWERCYDINVKGIANGCFLAMDKYLTQYKSGEEALIINTSSFAGLDKLDAAPVYSSSKYAVVGLSRSFGTDYHYNRTGIKVMAICPTLTDTLIVPNLTGKDVVHVSRMEEILVRHIEQLQSPSAVGDCVVKIVEDGDNGSSWIVHNGKLQEVNFTDYTTLIK